MLLRVLLDLTLTPDPDPDPDPDPGPNPDLDPDPNPNPSRNPDPNCNPNQGGTWLAAAGAWWSTASCGGLMSPSDVDTFTTLGSTTTV